MQNESTRLLFVEDDAVIASGLTYALEVEGYEVTHCATLSDALEAMNGGAFDLALLDLFLPDGSGFTLCEAIKSRSDTPVVFLTAIDDEGNTVRGLEMGADDYIVKPFRIRELLARLKAVLRRQGGSVNSLRVGNVELNAAQGKVFKDGKELSLTALEYRLLLLLVSHQGQLLTRNQLLGDLWDAGGSFVNDNTLSVYIKRLREKLGDVQEAALIHTIRGIGYRMGG